MQLALGSVFAPQAIKSKKYRTFNRLSKFRSAADFGTTFAEETPDKFSGGCHEAS
jgi:hypothetical protein